jgi:hypothetical protein
MSIPPLVPGAVSLLISALITLLANLTKRPPTLPPLDYMRVVRAGCIFDGSKAEQELGLAYTPIDDVLKEAVEAAKQ